MTNREAVIYKIVNIGNRDFYIGSSIRPLIRKNTHFNDLKKGKHPNQHLQRAWNKYGEENFNFEIIDYCSRDQILNKEQYYIDTLNPSYNICKKAYSTLGRTASEETKLKMRESQLGRKHKEESKLKVGLAHKGRKHSKEFGLNISNRQKKRILQYDLEGNFIKEWETVSEVLRLFNNVSKALKGKYKTCGGYIWKYKNDLKND